MIVSGWHQTTPGSTRTGTWTRYGGLHHCIVRYCENVLRLDRNAFNWCLSWLNARLGLTYLFVKGKSDFQVRDQLTHCRASVVLWLTFSPPRRETPGSIPTSTGKIHDIYGATWGEILCLAVICAFGWFSCVVVPEPIVVASLRAGPVGRISYNLYFDC